MLEAGDESSRMPVNLDNQPAAGCRIPRKNEQGSIEGQSAKSIGQNRTVEHVLAHVDRCSGEVSANQAAPIVELRMGRIPICVWLVDVDFPDATLCLGVCLM